MSLDTYIHPCNQNYNQDIEHSTHPSKFLLIPLGSIPTIHRQSQANTDQVSSTTVRFIFSRFLYRWDHTNCCFSLSGFGVQPWRLVHGVAYVGSYTVIAEHRPCAYGPVLFEPFLLLMDTGVVSKALAIMTKTLNIGYKSVSIFKGQWLSFVFVIGAKLLQSVRTFYIPTSSVGEFRLLCVLTEHLALLLTEAVLVGGK